MQSGKKIIAQVAPAFAGQFGPKVSADMLKTALKELGFADVYETAIGADLGAIAEAEHYVKEVASGNQPFSLTSCCPSWSMLAKKFFPETLDKISGESLVVAIGGAHEGAVVGASHVQARDDDARIVDGLQAVVGADAADGHPGARLVLHGVEGARLHRLQ